MGLSEHSYQAPGGQELRGSRQTTQRKGRSLLMDFRPHGHEIMNRIDTARLRVMSFDKKI
ncbi:hypothetical protein MPTK2_8g14460 [Marchantia polymorpha subsp. ruderalis]